MDYLSLFSGIGGMEKGIEQAYGNYCSQSTTEVGRPGERRNGASEPSRQYAVLSRHGQRSSNRNSAENNAHKQIGQSDDTRHFGGSAFGCEPQLPTCIGFSEIDRNAIAIYRKHFDHFNYGDATRIIPGELPDFDLLVGGFPCQTFSIAGKRQGFLDTRGTLFFEIARILEAKKPKHFLLENVKGLFSHDEGRTFRTIVGTLADIGYCVEWDCLNSKFYGVPQNRERVFIVGHLGRLPGREVFPIADSYEKAFQAKSERNISGTISTKNQSGQCNFDRSTTLIYGKDGKQKNKNIASTLSGGGHSGGNHSDMDLIVEPKIYQVPRGKNKGGILNHNLAPTMGISDWQHNALLSAQNKIRRLTPLECERLQGFPDHWTKYGKDEGGKIVQMSDSSRYKALGNAVTTNVITAIISKMMRCCDE